MEIKKVNRSDVNEVATLFNMYRMFYNQSSDLEGAITFINDRIENNESVIFVAIEEDQYLGFTQLYPTFSSVSMKRVWILNDLFVIESARKKGVAQKLLDAAKQLGIETYAKSIQLETANDNVNAQRLYEKNGYKTDGSFLNYTLSL